DLQMEHQYLCEETYGLVDHDFIPLASLARRHHLVQRGLECGEFVDEIFVHPDQRSERIVRRHVHRPRLPSVGLKACASRCEPCGRPRKGNSVANVLELADPLDKPLHPHAEARVRNAAVPSSVEVPVVRFRVFSLFLETLPDRLEVRLALAATDDFANAVAADYVECEDEIRTFRIPGLVEGLRDPRIVR